MVTEADLPLGPELRFGRLSELTGRADRDRGNVGVALARFKAIRVVRYPRERHTNWQIGLQEPNAGRPFLHNWMLD